MRRFCSCLWLGLALLLVQGAAVRSQVAPPAPASIAYRLLPDLAQHTLRVEMTIPVTAGQDHVDVQMPVWSPGDYHVMNHARYVADLHAYDDKTKEIPVTHPDENTWDIPTHGVHLVTIHYALPETPPGYFSENIELRENLAFLNGPAVYLYVVGHKEMPVSVSIVVHGAPPLKVEGALPWVEQTAGNETDIYAATAPDYDTLADSPIVLGDSQTMVTRSFKINDVDHEVVFFDHPERIRDPDAYLPMLQKVAEAEIKIMGVMPYKKYAFLFDVGGRGGGLEHLDCCRIAIFGGGSPRSVAPFVAHEFFHLWNVKRIRPNVLGPFDYIHPPITRNLWFCEGITEYYAHVATRRAGLMSDEEFLGHWRDMIEQFEEEPARRKVTADESSVRVWEAGNSTGYGISYYQKGELMGLLLDLKIRQVTQNARSLDDVMRYLFEKCNPPKPGYAEDDLRAAINTVAGEDLTGFYDLLARSTQELPYAQCLGYAGLDTQLRPLAKTTPAQIALRKSWITGEPAH